MGKTLKAIIIGLGICGIIVTPIALTYIYDNELFMTPYLILLIVGFYQLGKAIMGEIKNYKK